MATSGDSYPATSGDFFMATDNLLNANAQLRWHCRHLAAPSLWRPG